LTFLYVYLLSLYEKFAHYFREDTRTCLKYFVLCVNKAMGWETEVQFLVGAMMGLLPLSCRVQTGSGDFFPRIKRHGREADHSPYL